MLAILFIRSIWALCDPITLIVTGYTIMTVLAGEFPVFVAMTFALQIQTPLAFSVIIGHLRQAAGYGYADDQQEEIPPSHEWMAAIFVKVTNQHNPQKMGFGRM